MKLLTINEAAERLSLSPNTVRGLCKARKLRHERQAPGHSAQFAYLG